MKELEAGSAFQGVRLRNCRYLLDLMERAVQTRRVDEAEAGRMMKGLMEVSAALMLRSLGNHSSSLPAERAQQIFDSVCYCVSLSLKRENSPEQALALLRSAPAKQLWEEGQALLTDMTAQSSAMLRRLRAESPALLSRAYRDTLAGMELFFQDYSPIYAAQEDAGSIDYPLCIPVEDASGAEYLLLYLQRLTQEMRFCARFSVEAVNRLLLGYAEDARELLLNVFEIVLTNALGLTLLHADCSDLSITQSQRAALVRLLQGCSPAGLAERLHAACTVLLDGIGVTGADARRYVQASVPRISNHMFLCLRAGEVSHCFVASSPPGTRGERAVFTDNRRMRDAVLRRLIDEIQGCGDLSEKCALVQERVHSFADLREVAHACFFGDNEWEALCNAVGEEAIVQKLRQSRL